MINTRHPKCRATVARTCLLLLFFLIPSLPTNAQDASPPKLNKIELKVRSIAPQSRNDAPLWVEFNFKYKGAQLLTGPLLLEFYDGSKKITQLTTQQVVLNGGEQTYRFTLPTMTLEAGATSDWLTMRVTLLTEERRINLEEQSLFVPVSDRRNAVLAVAGQGFSQSAQDLADALSFNNYLPKPTTSLSGVYQPPSFGAFTLRLEPEDFPTEALGWTQFDVALLTDDGFAALGLRQLRALATWVKAGGAACVVTATSLTSDHVTFFNDTVDGGGVQNRFTNDRDKGLQIAADQQQGALSFWPAGLGRLVVLRSRVGETAIDESSRRKIAAFLWAARADQAQAIQNTGHWKTVTEQFSSVAYKDFHYGLENLATEILYQPLGMQTGPSLLAHLMPSTSRVVPFSVVVGILTLFILAVGPGDYYLLGFIRKRKWTWLLFPILSISFTVATVVIANDFRGREDHRVAIELHDVGDRGQIVKRSRLELVFLAARKPVATQVKSGLFAPINTKRLTTGHSDNLSSALVYEGRLPSEFYTLQVMDQWVAHLYRQTYLGPPQITASAADASTPRFNWDAINNQLLNTADGPAIKQALLGDAPFQGAIMLMGTNLTPLKQVMPQVIYNPTELTSDDPLSSPLIDLLKELTARPRVGYFSVVSRIAPNGGPMLEDLAMLDVTDPKQRILIVIEKRGVDLIIHRRLYTQ